MEKTVTLYVEPATNSAAVGSTKKGSTVKTRTGEVHTKPGKLIVNRDGTAFRKGDILWVYTCVGEGYFRIWYRGKFIEEQIDFIHRNSSSDDRGYFETMLDSV